MLLPVTAIYFQYLTHHPLDQGNTKVGVTAIYVHKNTCKHSTTYLHTSIRKRFRNPILPAPPKWDSKVLFQLFLNSRRRFFLLPLLGKKGSCKILFLTSGLVFLVHSQWISCSLFRGAHTHFLQGRHFRKKSIYSSGSLWTSKQS